MRMRSAAAADAVAGLQDGSAGAACSGGSAATAPPASAAAAAAAAAEAHGGVSAAADAAAEADAAAGEHHAGAVMGWIIALVVDSEEEEEEEEEFRGGGGWCFKATRWRFSLCHGPQSSYSSVFAGSDPAPAPASQTAAAYSVVTSAAGVGQRDVAGGGDCDTWASEFKMDCTAKNPPMPLVGDPYACAQVKMKGHELTARVGKVDENGSCVYLAICVCMYYLLKDKSQDILSEYLGTAEMTFVNIVAGYGERIVNFDSTIQISTQRYSDLQRASEFRSLLEDRMKSNRAKFHGYFKDKDPRRFGSDSTSETDMEKSAWTSVRARWGKFIREAYWDNVLAIVLGDMFPSLSILVLYSTEPLLQRGKSGKLYFFDGGEQQILTSKDEKMRIVLHCINRSLKRLGQEHNLRNRDSESSDNNHFEYVRLEGDLQFQFPKMDSASLTKLIAK